MIKQTSIAFALLLTVGCASQPSTYTDKSTPDQRNIEATGAAATEAARSNRSQNTDINVDSNVPLVQGTRVSYNGNDYSQLPGICCAYYPDGTRNYQREHEIYVEKQYAKQNRGRGNSHGDYARRRFNTRFDQELQRKIDKEVERWMDKIF